MALVALTPQGPCRTQRSNIEQVKAARLDPSHGLLRNECRSAIAKHDADFTAFLKPSLDHLFRERITDRTLNSPAHRPGSVERFIAFFDQPLLNVILDFKLHTLLKKTKVEFTQENVENTGEMGLVQLMEDHDFVDPIQELRTERAAQFSQDLFLFVTLLIAFRTLESERDALLDHLRPDIRGHDDDAILEVDLAPEAIGQHPVVQYL